MTNPSSGGLPPSGGYASGDEQVSRRLPLRGSPRTATTDGWGGDPDATREADNPFAGTALGSLGESNSTVNPFERGGDESMPFDDEVGRRARTSFPVVLGSFCSLVGACAVLTGELVVPALVLGGLGVLLSVIGLFSARRRHVSGRVLAVFALIIGLVAVGLAVAQHQQMELVTWLTPKLPHHIHTWVNDNVPFLH